jgi:predicted  nucleic acid-binding Zn-ribbon protein
METARVQAEIALTRWRVDPFIDRHIEYSFSTADCRRTLRFPYKDIVAMEVDYPNSDIRIEILLHSTVVALGTFKLPPGLNQHPLIETCAKIKSALKGMDLKCNDLEAEFNLVFRNVSIGGDPSPAPVLPQSTIPRDPPSRSSRSVSSSRVKTTDGPIECCNPNVSIGMASTLPSSAQTGEGRVQAVRRGKGKENRQHPANRPYKDSRPDKLDCDQLANKQKIDKTSQMHSSANTKGIKKGKKGIQDSRMPKDDAIVPLREYTDERTSRKTSEIISNGNFQNKCIGDSISVERRRQSEKASISNSQIPDLPSKLASTESSLRAEQNLRHRLQSQCIEVDHKAAQLESENRELRSRIDILTRTRPSTGEGSSSGDLLSKYQSLLSRMDAISEQMHALAQSNISLEDENSRLHTRVAEGKVRIAEEKSRCQQMSVNLRIAEQKILLLQTRREIEDGLAGAKIISMDIIGITEGIDREYKDRLVQCQQTIDRLVQENESIRSDRIKDQTIISELNESINQLRCENLSLKRELNAKGSGDLVSQISTLTEEIREKDNTINRLRAQLEDNANAIYDLKHELTQSRRYVEEHPASMMAAEVQTRTVSRDMAGLSSSFQLTSVQGPTYHPVQDDPIDKTMAHWVNSSVNKDRLLRLIYRLSPGNYVFGTMDISASTQGHRLMVSHNGSSPIPIEEFARQHLPHEFSSPIPEDSSKVVNQTNSFRISMDDSVKPISSGCNTHSGSILFHH